jgi:hypothetical protein
VTHKGVIEEKATNKRKNIRKTVTILGRENRCEIIWFPDSSGKWGITWI